MQIDFSNIDEAQHWIVVNDDVMGGVSKSRIESSLQATGIFQGQLSLAQGGGFVSIRRRVDHYSLNGCSGFMLRVKGDGRTYQFRLRTDDRLDSVAYRAHFTTDASKWLTVILPFTRFRPSFRGRNVPDSPVLHPEHIKQIAFLLADQQESPFRLEIAWIKSFE